MKLERSFYLRSALEVAPDLLGKVLVHKTKDGVLKGRIVEVEAYLGSYDKAAHSYKNKKTDRTAIQFGNGGFAYVYFIYGMHYCMNVVTNMVEIPEAILLRALQPLEGIEIMKKRRKVSKTENLCNGPGKLCAAMGITGVQYGADLCGDFLYIEDGNPDDFFEILASKRINIDYAQEAKDYPWRYTIKDSPYISVK